MSTYRNVKGIHGFVLTMLSGLLVAFLMLMPATVAFASAAQPTLTQTGVFNLAGVSVVRLDMTYVDSKAKTNTECTALGSLVASWPATTTLASVVHNVWVLTDGSVLASNGGSCARGSSLATIKVFASSEYTHNQLGLSLLDTITCTPIGVCQDQQGGTIPATITSGTQGAVLLAFHSPTVHPFLDTAQSAPLTAPLGIELASQSGTPASPSSFKVTSTGFDPTGFLTPRLITSSTNSGGNLPNSTPSATQTAQSANEPGMPLLDSDGKLVGMQLITGTLSLSGINALLSGAPELTAAKDGRLPAQNQLNTDWQNGMRALDAKNYAAAQQQLQNIVSKKFNPSFQAAPFFASQASALNKSENKTTPTPTTNAGGSSGIFGLPVSLVWIVGIFAAAMLLIFLLVLVSLVFGRRRVEMARFKAEVDTARRQIASGGPDTALERPRGDQPLATSSSGPLILRKNPDPALAPTQPHPPVSANMAPPFPVGPSISDQPTTEIPGRKNGNGGDVETTQPRRKDLRNVTLVVGHESDPGIKRKHKPNEDSLFALQGARMHNSHDVQFGLFVVADGMGGHANGQDASRLAIQTIVDYLVPKISAGDISLDDDSYVNLLKDGVQRANQAVHQRNMEERADMGTTMTAALVIGAMAYVANVGDSRTYLYRQPEGLRKITQDHSVVASLVEAGIIKPDDIYTHPKRNQIYRSLGEKPVVEVDGFTVPLLPGDRLLLCSDGLWDMVRDPDIQRVIAAPVNPAQTGKDLIKAALEGGGEDNVSVIVIYIAEATPGHTGLTGIQLLAKPETVTVPNLPPM